MILRRPFFPRQSTLQRGSALLLFCLFVLVTRQTEAWVSPSLTTPRSSCSSFVASIRPAPTTALYQSSPTEEQVASTKNDDDEEQDDNKKEELVYDYDVPEDAVIHIKPNAMKRLRELRDQQQKQKSQTDNGGPLVLRMGVRSGGCSGMSYVMDFSTSDDIQEDDAVDDYPDENIQCVVDAKSMLYLYGLELDYSDKLIGGGFQFYNPNAEESCGCGSSFGV